MGRLAHFTKFGFLTILIAIQCVGPLLHAHMGTPRQTGFHLDVPMPGLFKVLLDERNARAAKDTHGIHHDDGEPLSIDVEKGLGHASAAPDFDPALAGALLALFAVLLVAAIWVARPPCRTPVHDRLRWRGGSSQPPPAHAPPLFS